MKDYSDYKKIIDESLISFLPEIDGKADELRQAMEYSLLAGGKRIRPVLCLACCELCGGSVEFALPFAAAIEFIQTYSLIHDDLPAMDNDDYRRGKLTNHKVFGEDIAILAGDGLLSAAYEVMSKDMLEYLDDQQLLSRKALALSDIADGTGCRGMVAGQIADIKSEHEQVDAETLKFIHLNKTAAFIKAAVLSGAHLGGASSEYFEKLEKYADNVGLAFQIVDDIQDVIGDSEKRGKRVGGDLENEKSTYTALFGLEESRRKANALLDEAHKAVTDFKEKGLVLNYLIDLLEEMMIA